MGFIGTNPPAARVTNDSGIASQVDGEDQVMLGHVAFFKDSDGRISVLRYVKAQASIPLGAALIAQAGLGTTLNSADASTLAGRDPAYVVISPTGAGGQNMCAGIAAAAVSNTGRRFWAYIAGYCPDAAMPTNYASGQPMRLSASFAGRLSSAAINATLAGTTNVHIVAVSLGAAAVSTANSTNSVLIKGWLM